MDLTAKFRLTAFTPSAEDLAKLREILSLVEGEESDELLGRLFRRAVSLAEEYCGRIYRRSEFRLEFGGSGDELFLPLFPVAELLTATADGEELSKLEFRLLPAPGGWKVRFTEPVRESLTLKLSAGYSEEETPELFEAVVLQIAADLYEHREAQSETSLTGNGNFRRALELLRFYPGGVQ